MSQVTRVTLFDIARAFIEESGQNPLITEVRREEIANTFEDKELVIAAGLEHLALEKGVPVQSLEVNRT